MFEFGASHNDPHGARQGWNDQSIAESDSRDLISQTVASGNSRVLTRWDVNAPAVIRPPRERSPAEQSPKKNGVSELSRVQVRTSFVFLSFLLILKDETGPTM
jgi:hypothetical protein